MKMFNLAICLSMTIALLGCDDVQSVSVSGAKAITTAVQTDANGMTVEQQNIKGRLELEKPGAVKHLYILSSMSGDCILYSTVKGKVTSGGKQLMPSDARPLGEGGSYLTLPNGWITNERPSEDGTFGQGSEAAHAYLYWFDVRGNYHQHYLLGGQIIHISDVPMKWPKIILNLEEAAK